MINVIVNGRRRELLNPTNLEKFLIDLGISTDFVAVGYNGEVIPKEQYSSITLTDGDVLELVHPVGGG